MEAMEPSIDDAGDFYVGGRDTSKLTSNIIMVFKHRDEGPEM